MTPHKGEEPNNERFVLCLILYVVRDLSNRTIVGDWIFMIVITYKFSKSYTS